MTYELTPEARKGVKKLSPEIAEKIIKKLDYFVSSPNPLDFAESLVNYNAGQYRFRIGDYRVIFDVVDDDLIVLKVGHRREIYK